MVDCLYIRPHIDVAYLMVCVSACAVAVSASVSLSVHAVSSRCTSPSCTVEGLGSGSHRHTTRRHDNNT